MSWLGDAWDATGGAAWDSLTGQYDPSTVPNLQNDTRNDQIKAGRELQGWAFTGNGPSAAQNIIEQNRAQNSANQLGMAKSMGGDPALANRNAASAISQGSQAATYQGTVLRAKEQQDAMAKYLAQLSSIRGADMDYQSALMGVGERNATKEGAAWQKLLETYASGGTNMVAGGGGGGGGGGTTAGGAGNLGMVAVMI